VYFKDFNSKRDEFNNFDILYWLNAYLILRNGLRNESYRNRAFGDLFFGLNKYFNLCRCSIILKQYVMEIRNDLYKYFSIGCFIFDIKKYSRNIFFIDSINFLEPHDFSDFLLLRDEPKAA
jgi:hypothetical protein